MVVSEFMRDMSVAESAVIEAAVQGVRGNSYNAMIVPLWTPPTLRQITKGET
jgi:hypothetical protein